MDQRHLARLIAVARTGIGVVALAAPGALAPLIGAEAKRPGVKLITRVVGARDLALGLATLRALERNEDPATWVKTGAACDASDAVSSLLALRGMKPAAAVLSFASAAGAATLGWRAAGRLG